ncbi:oligosaccharide flippase family protein [Hydrogenophaga sp.]|uniref:oligosaccharide flippase family protein n=1 Tax=Hydrogenophaga sp. TaxID=1904254 RepID=UPI0027302168|nr:oligosaccharide flippase family protein [Hydrogenophaga sp.]
MKGAAWSIGMRWAMRVIGFLNTVIMARILMPEDYGIVAMAMLIVGLTEAMLDTGSGTVLLAKQTIDRDDIDSTWTLRVIQGLIVGLMIAGAAYPASLYFQESRVFHVLLIFAACLAATHACNIGLVLAQRDLNFYFAFKWGIFGKLIGVASTVISGWWLGDYRALVIGVSAGYISGLVLSYSMHPYRPRWNTSRIGEIWQTSRWLMFSNVAGYMLRKGDELAAARAGTTAGYGEYNVGADVGQLPTSVVGPAMLGAFLPVLSTIQSDISRTKEAVLKTLRAVNTITLPIGFIFAALATQATALLLGSKWIGASSFVAAFALISTIQIMFSPVNTLLFLRGQAKLQTLIVWTEFAVFVILAWPLTIEFGLMGLALARLGASVANGFTILIAARLRADFAIGPALRSLARPGAGAVLAAATAHNMQLIMTASGPAITLMVSACIAGLVYTAWSLISWQLAGRPEGAESTLLDIFNKMKSKAKAKPKTL